MLVCGEKFGQWSREMSSSSHSDRSTGIHGCQLNVAELQQIANLMKSCWTFVAELEHSHYFVQGWAAWGRP